MTPIFPYFGSAYGKSRHLPPPVGARVREPFAGGAGYSLFYDVRDAVLVEKDPIIAELWRYLIRVPASEILRLPLLPNVGDCVDDHDLEQGAKSLIGLWLNRGSATPKKTRTAYSARADRGQLNWSERARARVASSLDLVRGWTLIEGDFSLCPDAGPRDTTLIDWPFREKGRHYRTKFTDFERGSEWARAQQGLVIVLEGPGADCLPFRPMGSFKTSRGRADEYVWTNERSPLDLAE